MWKHPGIVVAIIMYAYAWSCVHGQSGRALKALLVELEALCTCMNNEMHIHICIFMGIHSRHSKNWKKISLSCFFLSPFLAFGQIPKVFRFTPGSLRDHSWYAQGWCQVSNPRRLHTTLVPKPIVLFSLAPDSSHLKKTLWTYGLLIDFLSCMCKALFDHCQYLKKEKKNFLVNY